MKSRPILFSSSMVRALLAGTKTQTRRVVKPQPEHLQRHVHKGKTLYDAEHRIWWWKQHSFENLIDFEDGRRELAKSCPHGVVGDRLWVRETWSHDASSLDECRAAHEDVTPSIGFGPYYRATEVAPDTLKWKPSIFMPRWASRIELEITDARVQRLHDISEEDAKAEGVDPDPDRFSRRLSFEYLWEDINGVGSWISNPFIWAISFKRVIS